METTTGEIKTFVNEAALNAEQANRIAAGKKPLIPLDQFPNPKCKKCYGRGHVGKDLKTGLMIPCKCVKKANKQTKVQGQQLTSAWGASPTKMAAVAALGAIAASAIPTK